MITQTVTVTEKDSKNIIIGRRGTYDTEQIVFDLSYLVESYGDGTAVLMAKRAQDSVAYPVSGIVQDGSTLTWTVSATDTSYKGHGECELFWYVGNALAKSMIYTVVVLRDIGDTAETAPEPYETWVNTLTALGAETLINAQNAESAKDQAVTAQQKAEEALKEFTTPTASAITLEAGSEATASYSDGHFTFGIPQGKSTDATFSGTTLVIN